MRPQKKLLSELNNKTDRYTVKVKVIDKTRAQCSPNKTKYQKLVFEDEKGNIMRATLFNDDVDAYADVILPNKEYEITDAPVKNVNPAYAIGDEKYQLGFNNRTIVRQLFSEGSSSAEPEEPKYIDIGSIDRAATVFDRFDVLGVVIYVEAPKDQLKEKEQKSQVREIVITDGSTPQPLVISAWNDLAGNPCDNLEEMVTDFPVVGFTAMRPARFKGFSLGTTPSTFFVTDPKGDKADDLRKWAKDNIALLSMRYGLVSKSRTLPQESEITPIAELKSKKYPNIMHEERYWIEGKVVDYDCKDIHYYLGCSNCWRRTPFEQGEVYKCRVCHKDGCVSTQLMSFSFALADTTGTLNLTAFAKTAESILGIEAQKLISLTPSENAVFNVEIGKVLETKTFKLLVGPDNSINTNKALKWVLKSISGN